MAEYISTTDHAARIRATLKRLTGWEAIRHVEAHGGTLGKYADPTEQARPAVTVEQAKAIAREDPSLIYCEAPLEEGPASVSYALRVVRRMRACEGEAAALAVLAEYMRVLREANDA